MSWKKKEKPLTPEEAIALAKKELAPFWYNSDPLLATVKMSTGVSVLPLNSNFVQQPWLYVFVDPTEFFGERPLQIIREWHRRYSSHRLGFIVVFRAAPAFAKSANDFLRRYQVHFPATYDQENNFSSAFGIRTWPSVVVQSGTEEIARGTGPKWTAGVEERIQLLVRRSDPGVSFFLPCEAPDAAVSGFPRADFGTLKGKPVQGFKNLIQLTGDWKETEDFVTTSDPKATAVISSPTSDMGIVAQAAAEAQSTKLLLETVDGSVLQEWMSDGMVLDENGHAMTRIQLFGLYYLLKDVPVHRRKFKLSFPEANSVPVNLYGLRFGEESRAIR